MTKRRSIIIGVIILILAAGLIFWLLNRNSDKKNSETNNNTSSQQSSSNQAKGTFSAVPTTGISYVATITITTDDKQVTKSTMSYDKNNAAVKYESGAGGNNTVMYYTKDALYMCQADATCYKYPVSQNGATGFDPSTYEYNQAKLDSYKDNAAYQGTQSCPAGTCDVWKVGGDKGTVTIYVDQATKRVSKVSTTISGGTSEITYDYSKQVAVVPPANAQSLPSLTP